MSESIYVERANKASPTKAASFDAAVAAIRASGIRPKCICKLKSRCTPEEWAAHREYMRLRYADPRCREMHVANQIKYLARKR
jgi:hypothetical protein